MAVRKIVPAYLGETFFGVPVTLGDDTALTMFALCHGRRYTSQPP